MFSNVTTTVVVREANWFVIMAWITIHFGRNPRNNIDENITSVGGFADAA